MIYATLQNMIDKYSNESVLLVADRDDNGVIDTDIVDKALIAASAEIDGYVAAKYELPLPVLPELLNGLCIDIAMYQLSADADMSTDEKRLRYDDAVKLLVRISQGKVSLGIPTPPASSNGAVIITSAERRFTRKSMKGL